MAFPKILPKVVYVILAAVNPIDNRKATATRVHRYAHKMIDGKWTWGSFETADRFDTVEAARSRFQYLTARTRTNWHESHIRLLKVTLHAQIEQLDPAPDIVDAISALAITVALEGA